MRMHSMIALVFVSILYAGTCSAETPNGKVVLEQLDADEKDIARLEGGEVVTVSAAEFEKSPRELAADAHVIIKKPLHVLLGDLKEDLEVAPQAQE